MVEQNSIGFINHSMAHFQIIAMPECEALLLMSIVRHTGRQTELCFKQLNIQTWPSLTSFVSGFNASWHYLLVK